MRVLVTGGAGFIGSHVVEHLLAAGHEPYAVDDLSSGRRENLPADVPLHVADVASPELAAIVGSVRPQVVCHLAAQISVSRSIADPVEDARVNVFGLLTVLESCRASDVGKVVFSSSGGTIYGEQTRLPIDEEATGRPTSPYGITKRAGEDYLRVYRREHGVDFTSLALANVYGPRQDPHGEAGVVAIFINALLAGRSPTINGTGEFTRDMVYVGDVAEAFVAACQAGSGETFNIGTGVQTSVNDLYKLVAAATGSSLEAVHGPDRPGDIRHSALNPAKAARMLGWHAHTGLPEGLAQTARWARDHHRELA